jgi:DNA-binding NtrC family response regulator
VAFSTDHVGDELLESINRPFRSLAELLDALMRALAERSRLRAGSLSLHGVGTLTLHRVGRRVATGWTSKVSNGFQTGAPGPRLDMATPGEAFAEPLSLPVSPLSQTLVLPICYADAVLGELRLEMDPRPRLSDTETELLGHFARHCGRLAKRYDVRRWSEQRLGRSLLLVGMSKALRELEGFLETSARGRLPVLLRGEFGTEKAQLAATIHCCGPASDGPFVQVDCAEPASTPASWVEQAEGGTLFLSDVDELDSRLQRQLPQHLPSRLHQWLAGSGAPQIRVIASTTADLRQRAHDGLFSRPLLAELDFLSVTIPPLRERTDDIEPLICEALERNGYRVEDKRTDALVALCRAYHWPENLFELERVIARLAVMTKNRPIERGDIHLHAPGIVPAEPADGGDQAGRSEGQVALDADAARWVRFAVDGIGGRPSELHDALRRALLHLGSHYEEPTSLAQLARHAGVSPSHLGFLFRTIIGMPFKALLGHIRVQKAREMLLADRRSQVTEIAMRVGFSDLSHFEKRFRRIVGQSPREFRRSVRTH